VDSKQTLTMKGSMVHIIGKTQPDEQPRDPAAEQLEELLDRYASAVRLSAFSESADRRREIMALVDNRRQLQDGEFVLEGVLFGAFFRSKGHLMPRQYRDPEKLAAFVGELMEKTLMGIGGFIDKNFGQGRTN
jgi:hypothetical protein